MTPRNPWRRSIRRELATIAVLTVTIIATFTVLCIGIACATPPQTPQQDGKFLFTLGESGIGYGDATQVIIAGHEVCNLLDAGGTIELVIDILDRTTQLGKRGALVFARISVAAYCGRHGDALRPHRGGDGSRNVGVIA